MTEIIVIQYNQPELAKRCLQSVLNYTHSPYNLRVYDNSKEKSNLGKLWNKLIKESRAEYICLLNDDTMVEPEWLSKLLEVFDKETNVGAVGPTTNNSNNMQCKEFPLSSYDVVDFSYLYPEWCLSGFCLVFPKAVFKQVGGFPEDFGFYGQETAFLDKITKAGYRQMWRKDVFVWHYGSASVLKAEKNGEMNKEVEKAKARERLAKLKKQ